MGFVVFPILRLGSSMMLLLFLFFLLNSASIFADNLPRALYSPNHDIHTCSCFENGDFVPYTCRTSASFNSKLGKIVLYFGRGNAIATALILVITLLNVIAYKLRELQEEKARELNKPALSLASEHSCRKFSLSEMELATHNFDEAMVIGIGGFGKVYKGLINQGASVVAIKRLDSKSKQGASEFWTEIKMLSKLRHSHLVTLFGYCNDYAEMILVYEYVSCGSLRDRLYKFDRSNGGSSLSWEQRLKICLGAARALDYLHTSTGLQHRIIHRDVKTSNILLDENWCAKISDFGVSKIGPLNQPFTHVSTDVKGSFGYFDPEYFLTRKLTRKSDVYAFGVVLFEVLFARPAVDLSLEEDQRGLAAWGPQCVKEGLVDQYIDPYLRGQILPDCLMIYAKTASQCLQSLPRKRPTMSEVVFKLESALSLQEVGDYSVIEEGIDTAGFLDNQVKEKPSDIGEVINAGNGETNSELLRFTPSVSGDARSRQSLKKSARITRISRMLPRFFSVKDNVPMAGDASSKSSRMKSTRTMPFSRMLGQIFSAKDHVQGISTNISNGGGFSATSSSAGRFSGTVSIDGETRLNGEILPAPDLRIYTLADLKSATRNFKSDMVLGVGGFGTVYKGWVEEKTLMPSKYGTGIMVAIKKLNPESAQGYQEWQSEVNFLGRLSHPNLVKLIGYCREDTDLLVVYEFMQKGSLENHLFRWSTAIEPLSWDIRMKIAIGAARGLAFLHSSDKHVIYRDFKTSNILLDGNYNAKISDFGLAKMGPSGGMSHVTTNIMGTYGYAAPEYVATGHLYVKSDVYGFGVVLLEMLTGLHAIDPKRPSGQHNLIDWAKPLLSHKRKVKSIMDARIEGQYSSKAAVQAAQLTLKCLEIEPRKRPSMIEVLEVLERVDAMKMKSKESKSVSSNSKHQHLSSSHHNSPHHRRNHANASATGR